MWESRMEAPLTLFHWFTHWVFRMLVTWASIRVSELLEEPEKKPGSQSVLYSTRKQPSESSMQLIYLNLFIEKTVSQAKSSHVKFTWKYSEELSSKFTYVYFMWVSRKKISHEFQLYIFTWWWFHVKFTLKQGPNQNLLDTHIEKKIGYVWCHISTTIR